LPSGHNAAPAILNAVQNVRGGRAVKPDLSRQVRRSDLDIALDGGVSIIDWDAWPKVFEMGHGSAEEEGEHDPGYAIEDYASDYSSSDGDDEEEKEEEEEKDKSINRNIDELF